MKLSPLLIAGTLLAGFAIATTPAQAVTACGPGTAASAFRCNLEITFNADGSITTAAPAGATLNYDGSDDALIGVINHSGHAISSFRIASAAAIFSGMDGDGINTFPGYTLGGNAANGLSDPGFATHGGIASVNNYGGADAYFTAVNFTPGANSGTVNFLTPIATCLTGFTGCSDFFSLEAPIDLRAPPIITTPEPLSIALLGAGLSGLALVRRRRA